MSDRIVENLFMFMACDKLKSITVIANVRYYNCKLIFEPIYSFFIAANYLFSYACLYFLTCKMSTIEDTFIYKICKRGMCPLFAYFGYIAKKVIVGNYI